MTNSYLFLNLKISDLKIINSIQLNLNIDKIKFNDVYNIFLFDNDIIFELINDEFIFLNQQQIIKILETFSFENYFNFQIPFPYSKEDDSANILFYTLNVILLIGVIVALILWFLFTRKK